MKWGKKKWSSASSHPSLISHVFPISWLTKLKTNKGICSEEMQVRAKHKGQQDLALGSSSKCSLLAEEGCFYGVDDDPYWRLSFGKETEKKSKATSNSAWFDRKLEAKKSQTWKLNGKMKDMQYQEEILQEDEAIRRKRVNEEEYQAKTRRNSRTLKEKQKQRGAEQRTSKEAEKIIFDVQPKRRSFSFPNCTFTSIEQECLLEVLNLDESSSISKVEIKGGDEMNNQWETLEDIKVKRMLSKHDDITGSISKDRNCSKKRRYHKRRTKAFSPRTIAKIECKIKGLEDKKKFRMRKKKTADNMVFDSYAVVKSSFDPKRDFRESMIEMIVVKGIVKPEELEKLLACYLTLNCDEYHDIIIKVFRQVWFELNEVYYVSELQNPHCYDHDQLF